MARLKGNRGARINPAALAALEADTQDIGVEVPPGYMVQVHISPLIQAELKRLSQEQSQTEAAIISSLIYAHFESASEQLRAIVDQPYIYHVFTTFFVDMQIAMTLIGYDSSINGYLLHKREANTLMTEMINGSQAVDLHWMMFTFYEMIASALIDSTVIG